MLRKLKYKNQPQWYTFTYISILLAMSYILLPVIRSHLPSAVNKIIMLSFTGLSFLGVIMQKDWYKPKNLLAFLCVIFLIIIIYFGKWKLTDYQYAGRDMLSRIFTLYEFWIFWVISKNSVKFCDDDKRKLLKYYLLLIVITSITTIVGCLRYPLASRLLAGQANFEESILFRRLNIGGYEFVCGIAMLIPFLIYILYKSKKKKGILLAIIATVCITIIISQYATALVMVMISIVASFILYFVKSKKGQLFILIIISALTILLFSGVLEDILNLIKDILLSHDLETVAARIDEIILFIRSNSWSGTSGVREQRRMQSFSVFIKNPLYGCIFNPEALGGHSEILDIMGAGGLIGLFMYVFPIINNYRMIKDYNKDVLYKMMVFFELIIFVFLSYVNTLFTSPDIALTFFFVPTLLIRENVDEKII